MNAQERLEIIKDIQRVLAGAHLYTGSIDGDFGPLSKAALAALLLPAAPEPPVGALPPTQFVEFGDGNHNDPDPLRTAPHHVAFIHKGSEGTGFNDPLDGPRRSAWKAAGKLWGFYHFTSGQDPIAQADAFVRDVREAGYTPDDLIVLDFENSSGGGAGDDMTGEEAERWLAHVDAALGCRAGVYGSNLLREYVDRKPDGFAGRFLWLADYRHPYHPLPHGRKIHLLQYTGNGSPFADMNRFAGTEAELRAQWPDLAV